jgi:hypothetical protein
MDRQMNSILRCFVLLVVLAWNAGCASERKAGDPRSQPGVGMRADSGLELRVFLPRDTISVRDSLPVEVQYLIVNGPKATRISNEPRRYVHRVERQDGRAVRPKRGGAPPTELWGREVFPVLPAHAWLGQTRDMRCLIYGGGYSQPVSTERDCLVEYDFREPGTYHVIVEYMTLEIWPNSDSLKAVNDTSKIPISVKPLVPGRLLADTATLVVLPE